MPGTRFSVSPINPHLFYFFIIPGLIIVICREDGLQRVILGEDGAANNDYFLDKSINRLVCKIQI